MTIPFTSIDEGDRARKDYGDLSGLKDSLSRVGLLHPIVLSKDSNNTEKPYLLIYGGRRYRAMKEMGVTELFHNSLMDPQKFGFMYKDEVPEHMRKEAELDENLWRLRMRWTEEILLVAETHRAKRAALGTGDWGVRQTAEILGKNFNTMKVSHALRLEKLLRAGDVEIRNCENMSEAISLLMKRKEDEALAEMQKRVALPVNAGVMGAHLLPPEQVAAGSTSSFLDSLAISFVPSLSPQASAPSEVLSPPVQIPLSRMFQLSDFRKVAPFPVDHIVTDIPYGIDMDNLDEEQVRSVAEEHDVEENVDLMEPFLHFAYMCVRSGGFCVFFYDLDHHEKLQEWAKDAGWKVQRWPFIACKTSASRNNAAQYNTTKNYECAMFLRKDEKTVLRKAISSSWKTYDFMAERRMYENPFAKPFELWKDIYDAISFPGQSVLDPFAGEMSSCRAAANCGLVPFGIEKKETHYNRGLQHMRAVYALIHKSNVQFT